MHKCDSCGKVVVNEQDYMCPHCGAVTQKHCDHQTHLPDDKYVRNNAYTTNDNYKTTASQHKSKTYDYEKAPSGRDDDKFDINDLANIKNAEDVKKITKKAFIEQDSTGRKKFKPLAIVLIVIFAVNVFGNLMSLVFGGIEDAFEELEYAFEEVGTADYTLGEDVIIHDFNIVTCLDGATFDRENDCLTFDLSELYFEYFETRNEEYQTLEDEWQPEFSSPEEYVYSDEIEFAVVIYSKKEIKDPTSFENVYTKKINLSAELSDAGMLNVYGLNSHIRDLNGETFYCEIFAANINSENVSTNEQFRYSFYLPFNFIKILPDNDVEFFDIYESYSNEGSMEFHRIQLEDQYVPSEYVGYISY